MTYEDVGFNNFLQRSTLTPPPTELSEDAASLAIPLLSGTSVAGGITTSATNKIQIDWEKGQILIGDGANWRVLLGEDGL